MWSLWISKVAVTLHPGNPYGPEGGGHPRNTLGHPHIYSLLPFFVLGTAPQSLRTWHPTHPECGQLAGISRGMAALADRPVFEDGRTSRSCQCRCAHKCEIGLLARRYVRESMNYMAVVPQPACDGLVFAVLGDIRPAHCVDTYHHPKPPLSLCGPVSGVRCVQRTPTCHCCGEGRLI